MTVPHDYFRLTRMFPVAPDRLWTLLTDPKAREIWGGPSDDTVMHLEKADLREGGDERHRCGPAEAPEFVVDTRWYHLDAPSLACFSETVSAQGTRFGVTLVTYTLASADAGSELIVDVSLASLTGEAMTGDFKEGWTNGLGRLERLIKEDAFA